MTTSYEIPTVGDYAARALADLLRVRTTDEALAGVAPELGRAALGLVTSCMALTDKFPHQARLDLESTLPFSSLELELMRSGSIKSGPAAELVARRVHEWVNRSPVVVDEANVHVVDFLRRLAPHLDLWTQREQVADIIERLSVA